MQESLFPEKRAPKDYGSGQYIQVFGENLNDNIAIVSSTPGSVSTARGETSNTDQKPRMRDAY